MKWKALFAVTAVSFLASLALQNLLQATQKYRDTTLAAQICDFSQNQAQIGATRIAFDQAYSLLRLQSKSAKSFVILKEGVTEYGQKLFDTQKENYFSFDCDFLGYADSKMSFYFSERPIWSLDFAGILFLFIAGLSSTFLILSYAVQRIYKNISEAVSFEVSTSLGLLSTETNNSKFYKIVASFLSSKVKDISPQIENLKHKIAESAEKSVHEAEARISLEKQAEKGKELLSVIQQIKHDIRSPLSSLRMVFSTSEDLQVTSTIENSVRRIDGIINDLSNIEELTLNSTVGTSVKMDVAEVMIFDIVQEKIATLKLDSGVKIDFDFSPEKLTPIAVSPQHFKRVISNLLQNSIESFSDSKNPKKNIHISISHNDKKCLIAITDNGCGIPKAVVNTLFTDKITFGKKSGSGLGLTHASTYIHRWGGSINLNSDIEQGTTVSIDLPLSPTSTEFKAAPAISKSKELIVVDDDGAAIESALSKQGFRTKLFTPKAFLLWFAENADYEKHILCFDFNLREKFNGADLARNTPAEFKKYLITDDYLNPVALEISVELNIPIIPKSLL